MRIKPSRTVAEGMLVENTPLENYCKRFGLWVKREDMSCPSPGPHFSKTRGVYARIKTCKEKIVGVLDTYHSQAGHAVARACQILGKKCLNFYPEFKHEPGWRSPQERAKKLGAELIGLPAGRSAILFHAAKRITLERGGYMMPNALKLEESIEETAKEVPDQSYEYVLVSASSGTIAAGVIRGFHQRGIEVGRYLIHLGYSRSHEQVLKYLAEASGVPSAPIELIDEGYGYKDQAKPGATPLWPCNPYYDLKAFRWWVANRERYQSPCLLWNIG